MRTHLVVLAIAFGLGACGDSESGDAPPVGNAGSAGSAGSAGGAADASTDAKPGDASSDGDATSTDGPVIGTDHPRILMNQSVKTALAAALSGSQKAAVRFRDMVDGQLAGGDVYAFAAWHAALMFQVTGETKYADYAIGMVDKQVQSEEALIAGGQKAEVSGDSYLYVGETIGDLALTYDWCFDRLTAQQRQRWLAYADQAVWNVWNPEQAAWGGKTFPWSGWSIDNPSNNYYYSFLRATMTLGLAAKGELPSADGWITKFRTEKIGNQLVPTFQSDLVGGGSREGTGYGVSMARLFELYYLWEQSTGESIANLTEHTRKSLLYMMHETVPTLDRVAPIGDHARDSTAALFDYHRNYALVPVKLYAGTHESQVGQAWLAHGALPEMSSAFMFANDFLFFDPSITELPLTDLVPAYYASGTGHVFLRSSWAQDATWVNFICGPFTESHAHQDQGSFLVYKKEWLAFDENILTHSGIRQEQELHNLVRISVGGSTVEMKNGAPASTLMALRRHDQFQYAACDMTPIFGGDANVSKMQRELVFLSPDAIVVFDRAATSASGAVEKTWQLNSPITPTTAANSVQLAGTQAKLDVFPVYPANPQTVVFDWASADSDTSGGKRIGLVQTNDGLSQFLVVLSLDNAVSAVAPSDAGTDRGVQVTFANGRAATLRFHQDSAGGTLKLVDSQSAVLFDGELGTAVETIPVFNP
ncbi:MAG: hypothetical protein HY898_14935 [Deltaproteobacteria bacterium]|nr:hypothetical protein [Deltaproteobacteria bacterium]